jgi:pectate lyase
MSRLIAVILAGLAATLPNVLFGQGLVGRWTFDADDAGRAVDLSGYGNHGDLVGSPAYAEGVRGTALQLDGNGQHVVVPASRSLDDLDAFTVAAWVKTSDNSNQYILAKDKRNASLTLGGWGNYIRGCVRIRRLVCSTSFNGAVPIDQWTLVAMTYDDGADRKVHLFVDGEEIAYRDQRIAEDGDAKDSDAGAPLAIGAMPVTESKPLHGGIDEVRVFAGALSAPQIRRMFEDDLGSAATDDIPPLVTITNPALKLVQTDRETIDLAGTAADASEIVEVLWRTTQGDSGNAVGGANWVATGVPLQPNENTISVTARDAAGNAGSASLQVISAVQAPEGFEGFGSSTSGGAGYPVFDVTSAAEMDAVLNEVDARGGDAIIKLSGSWEYGSTVKLSDVQNVTLTGIGADVTFRNTTLIVRCSDNVILQGLRIRNDQSGSDAIQINSSQRVVVDHSSVSGAGDGNIDVTGWACGPSSHVTVSWNIIADTWKQSLVKYGDTTKVSYHHNLFYNSGGRLPALESAGEFDIRNNVFWQWASSATSLGVGATANIVGNVYEVGPTGRGHVAIWYKDDLSKAWIANNLLPSEETDVSRLDQPIVVPATTTQTPDVARALILDGAGAWPRDSYDTGVVGTVAGGQFPPPPPYHD